MANDPTNQGRPVEGPHTMRFQGVPAPINLAVPPHKYVTDTRVVIGDDTKA